MAAAETAEPAETKKKRGLLPLLVGLILSVALGGGGFYAAYSGMLPFGGGGGEEHGAAEAAEAAHEPLPAVEFVPIDPMIVSLSGSGPIRHLRFQAQLEVAPGQSAAVAGMMPRVLDALNGYLRAVTPEDLERSTALLVLRAQMLRRIQLVVGETRVRDLLITEFVLN